jgi:hypothetical protein
MLGRSNLNAAATGVKVAHMLRWESAAAAHLHQLGPGWQAGVALLDVASVAHHAHAKRTRCGSSSRHRLHSSRHVWRDHLQDAAQTATLDSDSVRQPREAAGKGRA